MENPDPDLRAYVVWAPFLKADSENAARQSTARYSAPQAVYFWSPSQRLSEEMMGVLRLPTGRLPWDVYLLFPRGEIWDRAFPRPGYWQHQMDVVQGDQLNPALLRARMLEYLKRK